MIDVMKRLAELDAQNPNIVKESTQAVEECGMMGSMSSQPHTPASINMTAASGEELSSMLKDIMTLAGKSEPMSVEPVKGANGVATVDIGMNDEPGVMRSMLDKLNPDDEKPVEEYDNSPDVETQGYDSMVPSGNDLHKEKNQYPAAQPGDNAMSMEESLMSEWKKFVAEGSDNTRWVVTYSIEYKSYGENPGTDEQEEAVVTASSKQEAIEKVKGKSRLGSHMYNFRARPFVKSDELDLDEHNVGAFGMDEDSSNIESLKSFFNELRDEVNRGINVADTFHTHADRLPFQGKRLRQIMQFLKYQSAEADAAQDNPEEMKSIMIAAIDKAESALGIKNNPEQGVAEGSINESLTKNKAIEILAWLRSKGKQLEKNSNTPIGVFANEVVNYLYQVIQWLESNVPQNPKRDEYIQLMSDLRKTAKSIEMSREPNPRFANEVVNSLWPAMEWITSNVQQTQGVAEGSGPKEELDTKGAEWKQTSLSLAAAKKKYGDSNAKIEGKNRLGEPIVLVRVPLVNKQGVAEQLDILKLAGLK